MNFFRSWGEFMVMGARVFAQWEINNSNTILHDRKRIILLCFLILPILSGGIVFADQISSAMPQLLGGKKAYSPAFFTMGIFIASIFIGLCAGLITGCIGAGEGSSSRLR